MGPAILRDGGELAREEGVVRGDADGGCSLGVGGAAGEGVPAVLLGERKFGGLELESVGDVGGRLGERGGGLRPRG